MTEMSTEPRLEDMVAASLRYDIGSQIASELKQIMAEEVRRALAEREGDFRRLIRAALARMLDEGKL